MIGTSLDLVTTKYAVMASPTKMTTVSKTESMMTVEFVLFAFEK